MTGDRQGGRPPRPRARHFKPLAELGLAGGGYSYRECSFCRAVYENNEATRSPKIIIGRARNYVSHLAIYEFYQAAQAPLGSPCSSVASTTPAGTPAATQEPYSASSIEATPAGAPRPLSSPTASQCADSVSSQTRSRAASHSRARRCLVLEKRPPPSHKHRKSLPAKKLKPQSRKFKKAEIKNIERALIEAHADNHLPDRLIEQETILRFLELLCPGISDILPSRRTQGGRIRQEHAARCKAVDCEALKVMVENTGGWVNLLSDVWQNISKQHLLGCQLALFGILHTYDLLPAGDRHHGIAIAKELEQVLEQAQQEKWRVGAIVTDNAGQCGRARRILAIRWPHIVFCFALRKT